MICQILNHDQVSTLKDDLEKGLPGTAKIYYILKNFLRGLLEGFEVIVDAWPAWNCIVLRVADVDVVPVYFKHYYICHAKSVSALKFFIQRPGVIDWSGEATFTGVPCDLVPFLKDYCRKQNGELKNIQQRFMYAWTKSEPPEEPKVPEGLRLTTLTEGHVETLHEDWKNIKYDSGLDTYFKMVIDSFASSALVDQEGKLLAYICMQFNGSMAMLGAAPENQGKGYGHIILSDLTRKLLAKKEIAYGFIPCKDSTSISLIQSMGFTWVPKGNMAWFRFDKLSPKASPNTEAVSRREHTVSGEENCGNFMVINAIPLLAQDMTENSSVLCKVGIS